MKYLNISKFAIIIFTVAAMFTACSEDEAENQPKKEQPENLQLINEPAVIDGKTMIFRQPQQSSKNKGYILPMDDKIPTGTAYGAGVTYKTIGVQRGNGRIFYIMIENFRGASANSWAYNHNVSNEATYGRLYKWNAANSNGKNVMMLLPKYSAATGQPKAGAPSPVMGKLPSIVDFQDLLEVPAIGNIDENGTNVFGGWTYYNHFVFGTEATENLADANPILAGWRDNMDAGPENIEFSDKHTKGRYWTSVGSIYSNSWYNGHYPLTVGNLSGWCTAYINAECSDNYAFSVRYVFEPVYE